MILVDTAYIHDLLADNSPDVVNAVWQLLSSYADNIKILREVKNRDCRLRDAVFEGNFRRFLQKKRGRFYQFEDGDRQHRLEDACSFFTTHQPGLTFFTALRIDKKNRDHLNAVFQDPAGWGLINSGNIARTIDGTHLILATLMITLEETTKTVVFRKENFSIDEIRTMYSYIMSARTHLEYLINIQKIEEVPL